MLKQQLFEKNLKMSNNEVYEKYLKYPYPSLITDKNFKVNLENFINNLIQHNIEPNNENVINIFNELKSIPAGEEIPNDIFDFDFPVQNNIISMDELLNILVNQNESLIINHNINEDINEDNIEINVGNSNYVFNIINENNENNDNHLEYDDTLIEEFDDDLDNIIVLA